jgi:hypothetical protein
MWAPRSWEDVAALIGSAEETSSLDFKSELSKNPEMAKDIAAMTVDGGVIAYGIEEDKTSRVAKSIKKFPLAGVEERMRQVIGTRISPTPEIELLMVTENDADPDGVVFAVIPPSSLAPHMVDARYPRRHGTTTDYLTEAEVRRLYECRAELAGPPRSVDDVMADFTPPRPITPEADGTPLWSGSGGCAWPSPQWLLESPTRRRPGWRTR